MTDIASLGIRIDSTEARGAKSDLDNLTSSAKKAEDGVSGAGNASEAAGAQFEEFAVHARNHIASLLGATEGTRAYLAIAARVAPTLFLAIGALEGINALLSASGSVNDEFAKSLAETNNAAGVTVSQLTQFANQIALTGVTTNTAAQALSALVATGKVGADSLEALGQAAVGANQALGTSFQDTAKTVASIADAPVAALRALQLLTPEIEKQIQDLEASGHMTDAVTLALDTYSAALKDQTQQVRDSESTYTKFWQTVKEDAADAWNVILHPAGAVSNIKSSIQNALAAALGGGSGSFNPVLGATGVPIPSQDQVDQANATAQAAAAAAKIQQAKIEAAATVANQASLDLGNIRLTQSIQSVTDALSLNSAAVQSDSSVIEELHAAGLISDKQYYDTRRALIEEDTAAQVAALNKQITLIQQQNQADDVARNIAIDQSKDANTPEGAAATAGLSAQKAEADAQASAKIAQLRNQITQTQIAGQNSLVTVTNDQSVATQKLNVQLAEVNEQAQLYVKSLTEQYEASEKSVGLSDLQVQKLTELSAIQKQFDDDRRQDQRRFANDPDKADAAVAIDNGAQQQAEAAFAQHYKTLSDLQGDWLNGAKKAFADYSDGAQNVAAVADKAFTDAFNSIDDALVTLATTGKFSFSSLATSILADLTRMELKILESKALSWLTSAFGATSVNATTGVNDLNIGDGSVMFAANGADAPAGQPYIIGEKGPELFVPGTSGTIVPNGKWQSMGGSGGGINITQNINAAPGTDVASLAYAMNVAKEQAKVEIYNSIQRGEWKGALARGSR